MHPRAVHRSPFPVAKVARLILSTSVALLLGSPGRAANDLYWDSDGTTAGGSSPGNTASGTWGTSVFWNTDPLGGAAGSLTATTTNINDLHFSASTDVTGTSAVTVNGTQAANRIFFEEGAITLSGGSITLGGGGGVNPGLSFVNGTVSNVISAGIVLAADAEFASTDASPQTISGAISGAFNLATSNTTASQLTLSNGQNSFSSLTIKSGLVRGSQGVAGQTTALGIGTVTLGDTGGNLAATLDLQGSQASYANAVVLGGTSGLLTLRSGNTSTVVNFTGGITGTNHVTLLSNAGVTGTAALNISGGAINNTGNVTNATGATGSGAVNISAVIGANVTGVIQNSATAKMVLSSNANAYNGATTISAGTLELGSGGSLAGSAVSAAAGTTLLVSGNSTIGTAGSASVSIAGGTAATGGVLSLLNSAINTLNINSVTAGATVLTMGGAAGQASQLNLDLSATADQIALGAGLVASIGAGGVTVNLTTIGAPNGNTLTLISAPGGGLNTGGGFTLNATNGNFGGRTLALNNTGTLLELTQTANATPANAYWSGVLDSSWASFTGGNANNSNWLNGPAGADPNAAPGATTNVFMTANAASNLTTTLNQNFAINSLTFTGTGTAGTAAVSIGGGGNSLTIHATNANGNTTGNGITTLAGAGADTISAAIILGNNQTWTSNASTLLTVSGGVTGTAGLTLRADSTGGITISSNSLNPAGTVTNAGTGSGLVTISTVVGPNVTGVVQNSTTSQLNLPGANTFSSGLFVRAGAVSAGINGVGNGTSTSFGAGTITLGDTTGVNTAAVFLTGFASSPIIANPIVLADIATAQGPITVGTNNTGSTFTYSGGITGPNNLSIATTAGGALTFSTNPINHAGSLTNTGTGTSTATISGGVGPNVTGITQASSASALTINTNALQLGGDRTLLSTGTALFTVSGGITSPGAANLTLNANSSGAITLSTNAINHSGTITNSGTGGGLVTISGGIGSNVTGITQASSSSALTISTNAIQLGGNRTLLSTGTALLTVSGGITSPGAANLTLKADSSGGITLSTTAINHTGTITNSGGGSGLVTISAVVGSNVTGVIQNSATSTLLVSGQSLYASDTELTLGTLQLGGISTVTAGTLVSGPVGIGLFKIGTAANAVTLQTNTTSSSTRTISNNISLDGDITFATTTTSGRIALNTVSTLTTPNTITLTRTNQLTTNNTVIVDLIGAIGGSFGLTKLGPGTLNIGSATDATANTYSGLTTIGAGSTTLNKTAGTNAIAGNLQIDGGSLTLGANNENISDASTVTVNAGGTLAMNTRTETIGALVLNGGTVSTTTGTLKIAGAGTATIGSAAGTSLISSALVLGTGGLLISPSASGIATISGGVTSTAPASNITISNAGSGAVTLGTLSINHTGTITNDGAGSGTTTISGVIGANVTGVIQNSPTSVLSLTAANLYSSATSITAGTLLLSGTGAVNSSSGISINGSSAKLVQTATTAVSTIITLTQGTLDGTTSVGTVNVADSTGAILTAGNGGAGTLTTGALSFGGDASVNLAATGATMSTLIASGTLTTNNANGVVTFNVTNSGLWSNALNYNLITYTGGSVGGTGSTGSFVMGTIPGLNARQTPSLIDTGSAITLFISGDSPRWSGYDTTAGVPQSNWFPATASVTNWTLITAGTPTSFISDDQVLFDDNINPLGTSTVTISNGDVDPSSVTFNNTTSVPYTLTGVNGITGTTGLIKNNTGSVTIGNINSYSGATTISNGTMLIGVDNALPVGTSLTLGTGAMRGLLNLQTFNQTIGNLASTTNSTSLTNTITIGAGKQLTVTGDVTIGFTSGTTLFSVTGAGTLAINKLGGLVQIGGATTSANTASFDLSGLSVFTADLGATGTFKIGDTTSNTGASTNVSTVRLAPTSTIIADLLSVGGNTGTPGTTSNVNMQRLFLGGTSNILRANRIDVAANQGRASGEVTFPAGSGTVSITAADGTSAALLNIANTQTSTTSSPTGIVTLTGHVATLELSTLTIGARTGNSGAATGTLSFGDGTLSGFLHATSVLIAQKASGSSAAANSITGTLNLSGGTNTLGVVNIASNASATTGAGNVTGTLNISGGSTTATSLTLGTTTAAGVPVIANFSQSGGALTINGNLATSASSAGSATTSITLTGGSLSVVGDLVRTGGAGTSATTLTLEGGALNLNGNDLGGTNSVTFNARSGTLSNVATINDTGGLTKTTGGTLTVSGTNTYTGPTDAKAGVLIVSGSLSGSSTVTVGDSANLGTSAVLGGGGTVGNVVVGAAAGNSGATLNPHAGSASTSTGTTLHTASLTFTDTAAHLSLQLGRTTPFTSGGGNGSAGGDVSDHVQTSGAVTLNGADLQLSLLTTTGYTIAENDVLFLIINGGGAVNGTFSSLNGTPTTLNQWSEFSLNSQLYLITYQANFSANSVGGGNDVALLAIPEPSAAVSLLGGLALLLFRRRRPARG